MLWQNNIQPRIYICNCNLNDVGKIIKISQPEHGLVLATNLPPNKITTSCDLEEQSIEGNLLLHFNSCDITINEIVYKGNIYWDDFIINTTAETNIKLSSNIESLKNIT